MECLELALKTLINLCQLIYIIFQKMVAQIIICFLYHLIRLITVWAFIWVSSVSEARYGKCRLLQSLFYGSANLRKYICKRPYAVARQLSTHLEITNFEKNVNTWSRLNYIANLRRYIRHRYSIKCKNGQVGVMICLKF